MARHGLRREIGIMVMSSAGFWMLAEGLPRAAAAEKETRVFAIKIDGRSAGRFQMMVTSPDEHTFLLAGRADISVSYFLIKYAYSYQGTETWKDGRLVQLDSETNDNGKHYRVQVQADREVLRVRVNGKESTRPRPDVWTTTYWQLPAPPFRNQEVALLDCDTGENLRGRLQYVGTQQITAAGQAYNAMHYRLRGDRTADVWYDAQERLIHEEYREDGHHIELHLVHIDH